MSFAGVLTFKKNLEALMETKVFKEADSAQRLHLGGLLLRSRYGAPLIGSIQELKVSSEDHVSVSSFNGIPDPKLK